MADQIPIKVLLDGNSCTCGLAQFVAADTVGTIDGGTGLATQGICEFAQPGVNAVACKSTYIGICAGKSEGDALDNTYAGHSAGTAVTTGCQHTIIDWWLLATNNSPFVEKWQKCTNKSTNERFF